MPPSVRKPVADQRFHAVVVGAETPELHFLGILDFLGVAVAPFDGDFGVSVSVHQDIECAVAIEDGQEGHGGGDLSEDGLDFVLDFLFGLFNRRLGISEGGDVRSRGLPEVIVGKDIRWPSIFLVTRRSRRLALAVFSEDLNIELPPFDVFSRLLACNYDDKLRNLASHHPLIQLGHDLLDVSLDLVVGGD